MQNCALKYSSETLCQFWRTCHGLVKRLEMRLQWLEITLTLSVNFFTEKSQCGWVTLSVIFSENSSKLNGLTCHVPKFFGYGLYVCSSERVFRINIFLHIIVNCLRDDLGYAPTLYKFDLYVKHTSIWSTHCLKVRINITIYLAAMVKYKIMVMHWSQVQCHHHTSHFSKGIHAIISVWSYINYNYYIFYSSRIRIFRSYVHSLHWTNWNVTNKLSQTWRIG